MPNGSTDTGDVGPVPSLPADGASVPRETSTINVDIPEESAIIIPVDDLSDRKAAAERLLRVLNG